MIGLDEMIDFVKKLYKKAGVERTIYKTSRKDGFYIHPKNGAFLYSGDKRGGIFFYCDSYDPPDWQDAVRDYLIDTDDGFRKAYTKEI